MENAARRSAKRKGGPPAKRNVRCGVGHHAAVKSATSSSSRRRSELSRSSPTPPARLQDVLRIYEEALTRECAERAAYLDTACGDDADLRREVEVLLAEPSSLAATFLDAPPGLCPRSGPASVSVPTKCWGSSGRAGWAPSTRRATRG